MKQFLLAPALALFLVSPCHSETSTNTEEGTDLVERGLELLFQELLKEIEPALKDLDSMGDELGPKIQDLIALIDDFRNYSAPEKLPNGDIIIRRKKPLEEGEIDL